MRRIHALVGIMALSFMLVACGGGGSSGGNTVTMGASSFTGGTTITIASGQSVIFDDSAGGTHMLVTGSNGTFSAEPGAPSDFNSPGLRFTPGDKKTITFPTAGTYQITCTIHPSMQATITVTS